MKRNTILLSLLASLLSAFSTPADAQDTVRQSTGYPDPDQFYSLVEKNTYAASQTRRRYLMETTPTDSLIMAYIRKGHQTQRDSVSIHAFLYYFSTPLNEEERCLLVDKVYAYARKYKNERLKRLADLSEAIPTWFKKGEYEHSLQAHEDVIRSSRKAGDAEMEAEILELLWLHCFHSNRYARASAYIQRLAEALERAGDDYPNKSKAHSTIGKHYYTFKEYDKALPHLYRADCPEAWNHLAAYHRMDNNLDSAEYYHRKILTTGIDSHPSHLAIAISNLGRIEVARGNTDAGIAMLKAGFDYIESHFPDQDFMAGINISLGEAYLTKGDMATASEYITAAEKLPPYFEATKHSRSKSLYALKSSYHTRLGQYELAQAYLDSALMASSQHEQFTGRHVILLGEQQLQEAETQLKNQQITRQKNIILMAIAALLLISAALLVIVRLYRRRNAAYKKLAQRAQEWAAREEEVKIPVSNPSEQVEALVASSRNTDTETGGKANGNPSEEDLRIMALADREMSENHTYREAGITLDSLADRLGVHRNSLSRAISHVTGGNFSLYINKYRIKEAVRIISQTSRRELYIEELSERVGFGNRNTFSRAFKQFTGLSPLEFQKQKGDGLKNGEF